MDRSRNSSDELFEKLYREHGQMVLGITRRILRDEHLAYDACQLAFISVAKNVHNLPRSPKEVKCYISKTARNAAFDIYRKYSKIWEKEVPVQENEDSEPDETGYLGRYIESWNTESFEECLVERLDIENLLQKYSESDNESYTYIREFYYEELTIREIADKHNITEENARKRLYRSICKLKEQQKKGSV